MGSEWGRDAPRSVAIVGGGPSGSALATWLARAGARVTLFHSGRRPPLVIGESLVPAIVPFLRELGVEDEVRDYSIFKPGATFTLSEDYCQSFRFKEVRAAETRYSYNTPRDRLDQSLLDAARRAGAHIVEQSAKLERGPQRDSVRLSVDTLASSAGALSEAPELIVDASGRARTIARLLELPAREGDRKDTALFSHMRNVPLVKEGDVHTDLLDRGWGWRIPLPGRVSVGLVVPSDHARRFGRASEEQFDKLIEGDSCIRRWGGSPLRIAPVVKYTNYQLVSERGVGPGWALVGDAFGFIDPVFSSGLLVGLDSARSLARAIQRGTPRAFRRYEARVQRHLEAWQRVVGHFYNGRLMTLFKVGESVAQTLPGRLVDPHFRKHLPRVFTGEASTRRYSVGLADFMCRYALAGNDPGEYAVRG